MNFKKIILLGLGILLLVPIIDVRAFTYIDYIKDGNYVFFLVDIEVGNNVEFNVTHEGSGNFTLFLFNQRPTKSNVKGDKSLNADIFNNPPAIAFNLDDNPYINFTALESQIYYIEIILVGDGPDTFTISCTEDLTRYYLPIISSFRLEYIMLSLFFAVALIFILNKKKLRK